jgi:hypothetical protein
VVEIAQRLLGLPVNYLVHRQRLDTPCGRFADPAPALSGRSALGTDPQIGVVRAASSTPLHLPGHVEAG